MEISITNEGKGSILITGVAKEVKRTLFDSEKPDKLNRYVLRGGESGMYNLPEGYVIALENL